MHSKIRRWKAAAYFFQVGRRADVGHPWSSFKYLEFNVSSRQLKLLDERVHIIKVLLTEPIRNVDIVAK